MKVVALVSGGKDSCYSMMQCARYGHQIIALANLVPPSDHPEATGATPHSSSSSLSINLPA